MAAFYTVGGCGSAAGAAGVYRPDDFSVPQQAALKIVQELGIANFSIGVLGVLCLSQSGWMLPAAIAGGLFYGLAGIQHRFNRDRTAAENIATVSDLFI
jgi:hypothetical protein